MQRKIEARTAEDSFTGFVRTLYFADTYLRDSEWPAWGGRGSVGGPGMRAGWQDTKGFPLVSVGEVRTFLYSSPSRASRSVCPGFTCRLCPL